MAEESPVNGFIVLCARGWFVFCVVFAAIFCFISARKVVGFDTAMEIGAICFFSILIGVEAWRAPSRGQLSLKLSVSLLFAIGFILMNLGILLDHLTYKL